jgi:hypothetical protein
VTYSHSANGVFPYGPSVEAPHVVFSGLLGIFRSQAGCENLVQ